MTLNCQNYYFAEYSAGADILMEDAYPIGINATYSTKWDTPVNRTYGALLHTWRSTVQLPGIQDGKQTLVDGNYEFLKPWYERALASEDTPVPHSPVLEAAFQPQVDEIAGAMRRIAAY